jgi:hypothetical protein
MSIRPSTTIVPQLNWNSADWARYWRDQEVTPDPQSVTPESLAPETLTQIGDTAQTAANAAIDAHTAETDPHTQYATDADASALAANVQATAAAALADHEAASDPHPIYLTQTEADARYRELSDAVTYSELTGKPAALALLYSGTGSPEAVITAGVGSLYLRTDGGAGTTLYIKESGSGNTGWIGK